MHQERSLRVQQEGSLLAHQVGNAASRAYLRSKAVERRLPWMERYAEYALTKVERAPRRPRRVAGTV